MTATPAPVRTFVDHVADYALAGWPCIVPVPPETKTPPPRGFTGADGRDTDPMTLVQLATEFPTYSIALRMPDGVIGIDVDEYTKQVAQADGTVKEVVKTGATTLAEHEARWGALPTTWCSTARGSVDGPGLSRILLFRVPPGRYGTRLSGDVEIIQRHHRYAVVWPSQHAGTGAAQPTTYTWYDPAGTPSNRVPAPEELAWLPEIWVAGLAEGATDAGPAAAGRDAGQALLDQLLADDRDQCADITSSLYNALDEFNRSDTGSRHDTMTGRIHHLIMLAAHGHTGVAAAITLLGDLWNDKTAGEARGREFADMLLTSARKAVTEVGPVQIYSDPCLFASGLFAVNAPAPEGVDGVAGEPIEPPRWWSIRQLIGTTAFDPLAQLDQPLAERVLERTFPALRYAYDANTWLLRAPEQWETRGKLSGWAVAQVAPLLPIGNPAAEKGSDEHARSQRRARLNSTAGARAIGGKIDDLVAGGTHPAAIKLADLDSDPEILWAGGLPWSLRESRIEPTLALVEVETPHLHAAGVTPEVRPTPLWDALVAAVWPDVEIRAWALRVLSIALTGYADRALPILLGETGRGKTQVVNLIMSVLGSYAHAADPRLMSEAGEKAHASIVFALKGRRLSFIDEGPREGRWAQERLKQLTGGGELTANQMNQNPITFRPTHTLILTANDEPMLTDPAIRSRVRLIPCEGDPELVRVTRAAIGHVSGAAWRAEAPGVLAAMMAEAAAWLAEPTSALVTAAPESIRYLAEHVGAEQDPIGVWLTEETEQYAEGTASRELYQAFVASCRRNSMRADQIPSETKWGRALNRLGYPSLHTKTGKHRQLRLRLGGFLPGMPSAPTTPTFIVGDGLTPVGDGLVTGSNLNPSPVNPQVNLPFSENGDGLTGSLEKNPRVHAPARAREERFSDGPNPSPETPADGPETAPDLHERAGDGLKPPKKRAAPDPEKAAAAAEKRAQASAAKKAAAVAAAGGGTFELPALVLRDGSVRSIGLDDADQLLELVSTDAVLTVDVEHTGYPVGHRDFKLRTVQLGNQHYTVVLDPGYREQAVCIQRHLERAPALSAHLAAADLVPLAHAGLLPAGIDHAWDRMLDTGMAAKLHDPAAEAGLKKLAPIVLGEAAVIPEADRARGVLFKAGGWLTDTEAETPLGRSGWAQVDSHSETMIRYAASDVLDTAALAAALPWPEGEQLVREKTVQRMTARITDRGLRLDGERVAELRDQQMAAKADAGDRLSAYGVENPGSDQQIGAMAVQLGANLPRTATGRPSVAEGALEPMRELEGPLGDFVRARLDYQKAKTRLSLILEPYHQLVVNGDGRARPTVYTLGAKTGRMSCARPNLQQVPREGGFRSCITADPGHLLISADFSGVEIRVAAALSRDERLIAMLNQGFDLHWEAARQMYGPAATKSNRYTVKGGVFGWLYGGRAPTLSEQMGVSMPQAQMLIDTLGNLLPGLTDWTRQIADGVRSGRSEFTTYAGRAIKLRAPHAAPNYCIQGTARELLIDALMAWSKTKWGDATLLPVHDELVVMVPEDDAEEATEVLASVMRSEVYGIPIIVEASTPTFAWADAS